MSLTRAQKKYLKKNLKRFSLAKIAADLGVSEEEIFRFLKSHWRKEKYRKFLAKARHPRGVSLPKVRFHPGGGTGFKEWFKQNWKALAFLAFLIFTVYLNSLGNDFVSDDIPVIKDNPEIGKISYFWKPPYFNINLRLLIVFLTHKIFGLNPAFYRLSNILFHLGSVWIIYLLIACFFSSPVPFFTAGIFAVHPILTEAVTWISGGPYPYATFLILLSFFLYILSIKRKKLYLFSILAFILSLMSYPSATVFSLILLTFEVTFGNIRKNWKKLIPFFALSGVWGLLHLGKIGQRVTALETAYYQKPGIDSPLIKIPIAVTSYFELIFWPKNLTLYHSEEFYFSQIEYFLRLGLLILFLGAIVYFFRKDRRIFFWLSFFLIALSPTLTPLRIAWWVAERYIYLAALGIFVIAGLGILKIGQKFKNQELSWIIFALVILILSGRTILRNMDWKNQDTLWIATAKTSPRSPKNHNNLGDYYFRHGEYEKAIEEFKTAIELNPNYGDAYHNLANVYRQIGNTEEAIANYKKALSFNPNLWQSHQNLASRYFELGEYELALQELEKAVKINPQNPALYVNLGILYLQLEEKEKAKEAYQKALQLDPQNQRAKEGLLSL